MALTREGDEARFVGGCVRDAVLGRPVGDVDLATPVQPHRVMALLEKAGIRVVPTGLDHGTVTAVVDHQPFEITTLRQDVETDGRRAKVRFTDDWTVDASRRDFTMNALTCTAEGVVHDPFGGVADARAGRVRFIGDPLQRLTEDVLRLLRFFRFHAWYGRGVPDPEGLAACVTMASRLPSLSGERVRTETLKLLAAPDPAAAWALMLEHGIVAYLIPAATAVEALRHMALLDEGMVDPLRRLATLLPDGAAPAVAERLRLSVHERTCLTAMLTPHPGLLHMETGALRRLVRRIGRETALDCLLVQAARSGSGVEEVAARASEIGAMEIPDFPLQGRDVLDLGLSPGPRIGALLQQVESWWESQDFRPDRAACLAELEKRIRTME